ncbi:MAG: alpha/beta fold hydrolase, partial [Gammaproteobacteria bacterium]|nr:alpha/beta fold hydrolase [Gammaproteobacteria bacterium]
VDLSIRQWVNDLVALLDYLQIQRAHIGGASMGGAIAFQLALDHPDRVQSLSILNSQPSFALDRWYKKLMVWQRKLTVKWFGMERLIKRGVQRNLPLASQSDLRDKLAAQHTRNSDVYIAALNAIAGWTAMDRISELKTSVLMMSSDADYTSIDEKRRLMQGVADVTFEVIANSRHMSHWDQSDIVAKTMLEFLSQHLIT